MKLFDEKYPPIFSFLNEQTQTLEVVLTGTHQQMLKRAEGLIGTRFDQLSFPLSTLKPELREALLTGKPYVTSDGSDILGRRASRKLVQAAQRALGVNAVVDLPLWVKGKLAGTMTLLSQKERVPDEEMELLSAIASQAAIAIENARLFEIVARGKREWEATFDSVTEGIYLIDQNYTIIRANKAMAEGLGTRPQALIGRKCYEAVHQLKEPWSECPLQKALQTQQAITSELEDPNTSRTLQITVYPRFDEEGKALGSVHVVRDVTERKRREEEIERRNRELAALNAIAETVSGSLDLKEVLHRALDKVLDITGFEAGGIGLVDEAKELIVPMVHRGVPKDFLATFAQPRAGDGLRWQSVKLGEAIFFENLPQDSRVRGREALIEGFKTAAYLPLKVKEKTIGFMGLGTSHDHHFSPEEKSLLTTIASQIAVAIESARLYEESKEHAQRLERINERLLALQRISASVISTLDLREILKVIATNVATLLEEAYPPLFALFDRTSEAFRLVVATPQMKLIKKVERLTGIKFEGLTSSLAQMAPARREAVLARKPHLAQDASTLFGHLAGEQVIRATQAALKINLIVQLPLWVKGNLVGIMLLFSRREEMSEEEMGMLLAIADQTAMAIENARAYQELKDLNLQTITALATAIEAKDPYTGGHSLGVTEKAVAIAQEMGLPEEEIEKLRVAGLLHDTGKIGIPDSVLNKPGRLTAAEYVMIKVHPAISADIVGKIEGLTHLVPIIRHHHEWYDGNGYPDGLKEEEIPLGARILAVADGFDAMMAERPYRTAKSREEALAEIRAGAGTQWDPKVVKAFLAVTRKGRKTP